MQTKEQSFFLKCLADHLNNRITEVQGGLDWNAIRAFASQHQLEGIIHYQCKEYFPLDQQFSSTLYFSVNRKRSIDDIERAFSELSIPYIFLKGAVISNYFMVPQLRSMGDVDVLVHLEDKEKAHSALEKLGFFNESHDENEWKYTKNGIEIELHHNFCHERSRNATPILREYTDEIWNYAHSTGQGCRYDISLEHHLIFLIIHIRQHFLGNGCGVGFRQFMDLAVVSKQNLDWEKVREYLEKTELLEFAQTCFALCERWFDVKIELTGEVSDEFYDEATQQIFANGVFGFENSENQINGLANRVRKGSKFSALIGNCFPSYKEMCRESKCAFIKGKPYLLPAAWIYRIFLKIKKDSVKSGLNIAFSPYTKKTELAKREAYLQQWGL